MTLDPRSMPPLVRDFAVALSCSPNDQAWLAGETLAKGRSMEEPAAHHRW
jgi:hypothetical protein